jgi:hypothetical protein
MNFDVLGTPNHDDNLTGTNANETFYGSLGNDILNGGGGSDEFFFTGERVTDINNVNQDDDILSTQIDEFMFVSSDDDFDVINDFADDKVSPTGNGHDTSVDSSPQNHEQIPNSGPNTVFSFPYSILPILGSSPNTTTINSSFQALSSVNDFSISSRKYFDTTPILVTEKGLDRVFEHLEKIEEFRKDNPTAISQEKYNLFRLDTGLSLFQRVNQTLIFIESGSVDFDTSSVVDHKIFKDPSSPFKLSKEQYLDAQISSPINDQLVKDSYLSLGVSNTVKIDTFRPITNIYSTDLGSISDRFISNSNPNQLLISNEFII